MGHSYSDFLQPRFNSKNRKPLVIGSSWVFSHAYLPTRFFLHLIILTGIYMAAIVLSKHQLTIIHIHIYTYIQRCWLKLLSPYERQIVKKNLQPISIIDPNPGCELWTCCICAGQKISPDSKEKVQLQLVMHDSSAKTFQFNNAGGRPAQQQDRDSIKEILQQLLPKSHQKISGELEEKNRYNLIFKNYAIDIWVAWNKN